MQYDTIYADTNGLTPSELLTYQEVKYKNSSLNGASWNGLELSAKIFARPENQYILDTSVVPGTTPNTDFWNAQWFMGAQMPFPPGAGDPYSILYYDIVEMLYDGLDANM